MFLKNRAGMLIIVVLAVLMTGCAHRQAAYDYSAFKESRPTSILILPPINDSPDVKATYSVLSQLTWPLAEAGYYVMPVTLVDEMFKQNGLVNPPEMHAAPIEKLRSIFGADAALYVTVKQYGSSYQVFASVATVQLDAKLVDLQTGKLLWQGTASVVDNPKNNVGGGGVGALIGAALTQIVNNSRDISYKLSATASSSLLYPKAPNGMLYGPRSERFEHDGVASKRQIKLAAQAAKKAAKQAAKHDGVVAESRSNAIGSDSANDVIN
ncbi:DUF799 domain-containing protein [Glaciimonas soli]|uniref:Lipoprotein n=1 Tax=Glaciimonas soli TaxID=2590999 RepID=A0A843YSV0_9BURK|nr:DUF799 domain-containing protein [Glaciimonas soli]MQR02779.1 hypothetical protein [Glaciimonas soli]